MRRQVEKVNQYYDLDILEEYAESLGFAVQRTSADCLAVRLAADVVLEFHNLRDKEDILVGFQGTSWHSHEKTMMLMTDEATYVECDELDVLNGIKSGEILIVEQRVNGRLNDRWIAHRKERLDVRYMEPGEELRVYRLP